jgi:hypothetical protein
VHHIKHTKCPDCGAGIKSEVRQDQHTNGHWNETVVFTCGARHHFSPNFMQIKVQSPCPTDPAQLARNLKRAALLKELRDTIADSNADRAFAARLADSLKYFTVDTPTT